MTWRLTNTETGEYVDLPVNPESAAISYSAIVESIEIPGDAPFIFAMGKETPRLRISGSLYVYGQTRDYLITNYVNKIQNMVMKVVQISNAGSGYDGNWILIEFSWEEEAGTVNRIKYSCELIKGSEMVTL